MCLLKPEPKIAQLFQHQLQQKSPRKFMAYEWLLFKNVEPDVLRFVMRQASARCIIHLRWCFLQPCDKSCLSHCPLKQYFQLNLRLFKVMRYITMILRHVQTLLCCSNCQKSLISMFFDNFQSKIRSSCDASFIRWSFIHVLDVSFERSFSLSLPPLYICVFLRSNCLWNIHIMLSLIEFILSYLDISIKLFQKKRWKNVIFS